MSGFSHEWLALREGADAAARNDALTRALVARLRADRGLRVLDLGAGTGANLRYLAPLLGRDQDWRLIDNDAALLGRLPSALSDWARMQGYRARQENKGLVIGGPSFSAVVRWARLDLATNLADLSLAKVDLVTASALLDLVSSAWLDSLALACHRNRCAVLFALNYDGRIEWRPALREDAAVEALLNRHQRRNKNFGPALGPEAGTYAAERFTALGYQIQTGPSDWHLDVARVALQRALVAGWARAALELLPKAQPWIDVWLGARTECLERGDSRLTVGHIDLLALPLPAVSEQA